MNKLMISAVLVATPRPRRRHGRRRQRRRFRTIAISRPIGERPDARGRDAIRYPCRQAQETSSTAIPATNGRRWQEGEVTFTIKGQPPQVLKAGDSNYVPRGTVHRQQNLTDKPARYIEMRIFDKGKPASEQVVE